MILYFSQVENIWSYAQIFSIIIFSEYVWGSAIFSSEKIPQFCMSSKFQGAFIWYSNSERLVFFSSVQNVKNTNSEIIRIERAEKRLLDMIFTCFKG